MEEKCRIGWVSWVCDPHCKPYLSCVISGTRERAEKEFCDDDGERSRMFKDSKIIHQKIEISMPDEVVAEYDKWLKYIGGKYE